MCSRMGRAELPVHKRVAMPAPAHGLTEPRKVGLPEKSELEAQQALPSIASLSLLILQLNNNMALV